MGEFISKQMTANVEYKMKIKGVALEINLISYIINETLYQTDDVIKNSTPKKQIYTVLNSSISWLYILSLSNLRA